jgi:hypothetical protein
VPKPALDPVAHHRVSYGTADHEAHPDRSAVAAQQPVDDETRSAGTPATAHDFTELRGPTEPVRLGQHG